MLTSCQPRVFPRAWVRERCSNLMQHTGWDRLLAPLVWAAAVVPGPPHVVLKIGSFSRLFFYGHLFLLTFAIFGISIRSPKDNIHMELGHYWTEEGVKIENQKKPLLIRPSRTPKTNPKKNFCSKSLPTMGASTWFLCVTFYVCLQNLCKKS